VKMLANSGLQMATLTTSFVFLMIAGLYVPSGSAYFIPDSGDDVVKRAMELVRDKRYTDTQERASSFCTGLCMYEERLAYSDCFDLCNWNGRSPSPWGKLDKLKNAKDFPENNTPDKMAAFMRTGGVSKAKPGEKAKIRGRSGNKNSPSWDISY
jgi:hypothetical protein